jgi:hypothetical protein
LKCVALLHDSAPPHTAAHIAETRLKLKFCVLAHPPYRPNLTPCAATCLIHSKRQ